LLWQLPDQGAEADDEADDEADGPMTGAFAGAVAPLGSDALGLWPPVVITPVNTATGTRTATPAMNAGRRQRRGLLAAPCRPVRGGAWTGGGDSTVPEACP